MQELGNGRLPHPARISFRRGRSKSHFVKEAMMSLLNTAANLPYKLARTPLARALAKALGCSRRLKCLVGLQLSSAAIQPLYCFKGL